jgi:protein-S-isoprenylcysteine O-methyltransferase Ste14
LDALVYAFHGLFWGAFLVRVVRRRASSVSPTPSAASPAPRRDGRARLVFALHGLAFGVLYSGIGKAVSGERPVSRLFSLPWGAGALVIVASAALIASALWVFDSWRLLARIDAGHRLCTRGPYGRIRHPIYLACDLLALGTFLWLPTAAIGVGTLLMVLTGDLRARAEERLLADAFGDEYLSYAARVKRLLPGLY